MMKLMIIIQSPKFQRASGCKKMILPINYNWIPALMLQYIINATLELAIILHNIIIIFIAMKLLDMLEIILKPIKDPKLMTILNLTTLYFMIICIMIV